MGFEVDFLPVGEGEKSGDAIAVRFGDWGFSQQTVIVIDGGTQDSGVALVKHLRQHYNTTRVDFAILTHPDGDHASGLRTVLEEMQVGNLLMHRPWQHAADIREMFQSGRLTTTGLKDKLKEGLDLAWELEQMAVRKKIPITEPFAGVQTDSGSLLVLGPTEEYYQSLLPEFRCTPEPRSDLRSIVDAAVAGLKEAGRFVFETIGFETLNDAGETPAENNSSAIVLLTIDGHRLLFTGDAGIPSLSRAADFADSCGIDLTALRFLQVPHHGSKRNVGPCVLDRIKAATAYVSVAPDGGLKHPSKKVTNALIRRGASVYATQGKTLCHHLGVPARAGWVSVTAIPFFNQVEA
jgi:beta-lactamase superfamily II metal-dependent hydrolase